MKSNEELTPHMVDLLLVYGRLGSIQAVADHFGAAPSTIKNQLTTVYQRLGAVNSTNALYLYLLSIGCSEVKTHNENFG